MPEGCLSHRDSGPTKSAARDDERAAEGRSGEAGASGSAAETVRRTVWPAARTPPGAVTDPLFANPFAPQQREPRDPKEVSI